MSDNQKLQIQMDRLAWEIRFLDGALFFAQQHPNNKIEYNELEKRRKEMLEKIENEGFKWRVGTEVLLKGDKPTQYMRLTEPETKSNYQLTVKANWID